MIRVKRIYVPASQEDGQRFLVDRLWPRGIKKEALQIVAWIKDVAPSDELRHWYGHDPDKWCEFNARYLRSWTASRKTGGPCLRRLAKEPSPCYSALKNWNATTQSHCMPTLNSS